jgi:site-specific recombinase XerD
MVISALKPAKVLSSNFSPSGGPFMLPEIVKFQKWLRRRNPHASTSIHYVSDVNLFFAWINLSPQAIIVQEIDRYIEHSRAIGHSIATVNRRLASLHSFYEFLAMESDAPVKNPVIPYRHYIRQCDPLPRDVEDAVLEKLFAVIHHPRDRAMFTLMLRCGLRVSEVRTLTMNDLYLQPTPGSLPRLWIHGKGDKERIMYLSSQPRAILQQWLKVRPVVEDQAVFLNRFDQQLTVTGIQFRLAQYCRTAGVWVTCHQFRHTLGRHLTEARTPVTSIQRLFGHARLRTTEIYLHVSNMQVQADYEAAMQQVTRRLQLEMPGGAR